MKPWVPSPAPHKPGVHTSVSWASGRQRREDPKTIPAVYEVWGQHELPKILSQKKKISKKYRLCWQVKIIWNSTGKLISPFFHAWSVSVPCHEVDRRALRYFLAYTCNDSRPGQKKLADLCSECCARDVLSCSYSCLFVSCFVCFWDIGSLCCQDGLQLSMWALNVTWFSSLSLYT